MNAGSNRLPTLAAEIRAAHTGVLDAAKTAAERAIEAGNALLEAKELVKHGEWLPWLKEHCRLPERTSQFYMKIAKLGLKPATVADLGLKAAAKAIVFHYDPFEGQTEAEVREWRLYLLYLIHRGAAGEGADHHISWLLRQRYRSPDEWLDDSGQRTRWGLRQVPASFKRGWKRFAKQRSDMSLADIEAALGVSP